MKEANWTKYGFEFLSIFIAVIAAFALNNWNENRRERITEQSILTEIANGLEKDMADIEVNKEGHEVGIKACKYWRRILMGEKSNKDSIQIYFFTLTRDFNSLQNSSGYTALKSRGLEIIKNDSLRSKIISLYEYEFYTIKNIEEDYEESQFHKSFYPDLSRILAPNLIFDEKGNPIGVVESLNISTADEKLLLSHLYKIQINRMFALHIYKGLKEKILNLKEDLKLELE